MNRIVRRNFLTLDGRTFSFNMTNHLNPQQNQNWILREICQGITTYYQGNFPIWSRLIGGNRVFEIPPMHPFFPLLDTTSQVKLFNCLIFKIDRNVITVTHFGPFGKEETERLKQTIKVTHSALKKLKKRRNAIQSPSNTKSEGEKKKDQDGITQDLKNNYWRCVEIIESNIRSKQKELIDLINRVFEDDKVTADDLIKTLITTDIELLTKTTAKTIGKKVTIKIGAKTAAKIAAKSGAKGAVKVGAKAGAKAVPVAGLVIGLGFGIWRVCHGDVAGAGLEVASGALSCVPGGGTAGSLAIDVGIAARDIKLEIEEYKRIEEVFFKNILDSMLATPFAAIKT